MDSRLNKDSNYTAVCKLYNLDEFRCYITKLAADAYFYNFGYICLGLIYLIILISIFGGIKEKYRWFILNQAIWDILLCYNFSCGNLFYSRISRSKYCFWTTNTISTNTIFDFIIQNIILTTPYSASFLLSASRFLALYCTNIYSKLMKTKILIFSFLIFYLFIFFCCCNVGIFYYLQINRANDVMTPCLFQLKSFDDGYFCSNQLFADTLFLTFNIIYFVFNVLTTLIPLICLFLSIFASLMVTICLIKQSKFQWKHNRKDFYNSSRICVVIFLQSFLNSFIFILQLIAQLHWYFLIVTRLFPIQILTNTQKYGETSPQKSILNFRLPIWVHGEWGLASNDALQLILQFRIFIESITIFFIMTGYREAFWKFIKVAFFAVKNPKTFWNETLHNKTSVVILSSSG